MRAGLDIQEIVKAVVQVLEERQRVTSDVTTQALREQWKRPLGGSTASANGNVGSQNWHQIKFATKSIPVFEGKEEENVAKWLERISSVARLYHFNDKVLVMTAVSQLKNRVLEWYNRQTLEEVVS